MTTYNSIGTIINPAYTKIGIGVIVFCLILVGLIIYSHRRIKVQEMKEDYLDRMHRKNNPFSEEEKEDD